MLHLRPGYHNLLLLVCILFCTPTVISAQQQYEPGYLIDTSGARTEVRIFNKDWRYHPEKIQVIGERETEPAIISTAQLSEFGIHGKARYVNREVAIERSSTETKLLSDTTAQYRKERVLLRVEVEGSANLYSYLAPRVEKYFLSTGDGLPTQLVYTRTLTSTGQIAEVRAFVQQLSIRLQCGNEAIVRSQLRYALAALRKVVERYNTCQSGGSTLTYQNAPSGSKSFRLTLLPGLYATDFRFMRTKKGRVVAEMPYQVVPRLGADLELTLPFAGDKLAVLLRPSYYRFSDSAADLVSTSPSVVSARYEAFDIPLAVRYYSFLTPDLKLFATGGVGCTVISGGVLQWGKRNPMRLDNMISLAAEVGARYRDHWNLSVGYEKDTSSLPAAALATKSRGMRIMLGYTL